MGHFTRKTVFQPPLFSGDMSVFGGTKLEAATTSVAATSWGLSFCVLTYLLGIPVKGRIITRISRTECYNIAKPKKNSPDSSSRNVLPVHLTGVGFHEILDMFVPFCTIWYIIIVVVFCSGGSTLLIILVSFGGLPTLRRSTAWLFAHVFKWHWRRPPGKNSLVAIGCKCCSGNPFKERDYHELVPFILSDLIFWEKPPRWSKKKPSKSKGFGGSPMIRDHPKRKYRIFQPPIINFQWKIVSFQCGYTVN